jgi:multidrug efflux pump subunit AcrA (membrane-fusion protein)
VSVDAGDADTRTLLWQLRWGSAWLEALLARQQVLEDSLQKDRTILAFDLIGLVFDHGSFKAACDAITAELAERLSCDPVSIAFLRKGRMQLVSLSHSAQFGDRMSFVRQLEMAMEEASDQASVVLAPSPEDWEYRVNRCHEELLESHKVGSALTVPLRAGGEPVGALTLERDAPFTDDEVELVDSTASVLGPLLFMQQREDESIWRKIGRSLRQQAHRLFGPHHVGRKVVTAAALLLIAVFTVVTGNYRVTAPAVVEGLVQRAIVAPFDGYIETQHARAGEVVEEGELLATLDDQDLALERIRWSTKSRQSLAEYDQALARRERSSANIIRAELEQAQAQVQLLDQQLARTRITAPFHGVIVAGDLSQKVGGAVRRGEELFRLAPLEDHRVILKVDESDIMDIEVGQQGSLRLASLPDRPLAYEVTLVTSIAEQEEGRNYFRVEALLKDQFPDLRPGMQGVAKTQVEDRLVIRIWTEKLVDWLRMFAWTWSP